MKSIGKAAPKRATKGRPKKLKSIDELTNEEIDAQLAILEAEQVEIRKVYDQILAENPFYGYKPTTGEIHNREFLGRWLKEEDIPQRLDGQMDAHMSTAQIIGVSGGNQAGKSVSGCVEAFIQATGELPLSLKDVYPKEKLPKRFPRRIRVVGVSANQMLNTVLPTYRQWCPKEFLKKGSWAESYSAEKQTLFLYKGSKEIATIEFKTNQQDVETFQGPPLDMVIYDEEPRSEIHKENLMRFVTAERINFLFCWTPTKGLTWTSDLFLDAKENVERFQLCSVSNPKANVEVLENILGEIETYDELKMRLLGEFVSLSGLVYGRLFDPRVHVIEPFPINKDEFIVFRGIDPHTHKATYCVELAIDREGNEFVCGTYSRTGDTQEIKDDLAQRAIERNYRLGWTQCDRSADSTNHALSDRNIYQELSRGRNAIPGLDKSEKFIGSINAGVDEIKKLLKVDEAGKPRMFVFNIPENKELIHAFRSMERDTYANEDIKGLKDRIREGPHDAHAALRYIHQRRIRWIPRSYSVPEYVPVNEMVGY